MAVDDTDELSETVTGILVSVVWLMIDVALTVALIEVSGKSDVTEEMMTVTGPPVTVASLVWLVEEDISVEVGDGADDMIGSVVKIDVSSEDDI